MNPDIVAVEVSAHYVVRLTFADGSQGTVDLRPWISGRGGLFAPLQDPAYFEQVSVDREAGTIVWPNGADIDPDMLFLAARGLSAPA